MDRNPTASFARSPLTLSGGRSSSFLTYEPYYGLNEKPFSLSADPRFLYRSPSHAATFDDLLLGIRRREGLIVLTGDIGAGKTTLCRAVLDQLDRKTFSTFVPDPFVSREDLLRMLLIDFGVMSVDDLKSGRLSGATRPELSYPLYEFLKSLLPLQAFAVLVIDEAQNLSPSLLEEIRILSDMEAPEKLLQVVLVGQLEFRAKLKLPEMRQLDQRVSVRCNLEPLQRDGVTGYIAHRLKVAGGGFDRVEFSPDAVHEVFQASAGVPRLINLICDRALYRGYQARSARIDADIVALAVTDLGVGDLTPTPPAISNRTQPSRKTEALFSGRDVSRAEDTHIDFKVLDERFEIGTYEPTPSAASAVPQAVDRRTGETSSIDFRRTALRLGESISADRWPRRNLFVTIPIAIVAIALVAVLAGFGLTYVYPGLYDDPQAPALPAAPSLLIHDGPMPPSAPSDGAQAPPAVVAGAADGKGYAIDVAMFQSVLRAGRLVEQLVAADYPAYQIEMDLGARGRAYVVMVGAYQVPADAATDLARIQQIPGHADAKVIPVPSKALPQ